MRGLLGKWDVVPRETKMWCRFLVQRGVQVGLEYYVFWRSVGYSSVLIGFLFVASRRSAASQ